MKREEASENIYAIEAQVPRVKLFEDIVLSKSVEETFNEVFVSIRNHKIIYHDWGFKEVDPNGRNFVLNFYGPPGTGKTLSGEGVAGVLGLNYFYVGISQLESRYVGETARNITKIFKHATESGAIVFFDEADTLLGARLSNVTQGLDNEINAMRSTMLIELEKFEGITIFATNFITNYDKAFSSRIRYNIAFTLPDQYCRERLWFLDVSCG